MSYCHARKCLVTLAFRRIPMQLFPVIAKKLRKGVSGGQRYPDAVRSISTDRVGSDKIVLMAKFHGLISSKRAAEYIARSRFCNDCRDHPPFLSGVFSRFGVIVCRLLWSGSRCEGVSHLAPRSAAPSRSDQRRIRRVTKRYRGFTVLIQRTDRNDGCARMSCSRWVRDSRQ